MKIVIIQWFAWISILVQADQYHRTNSACSDSSSGRRAYYELANKIDRSIYQGDYNRAVNHFDTLLLRFDRIFYHDLITGLKLNLLLNRENRVSPLVERIITQKGISLKQLMDELPSEILTKSFVSNIEHDEPLSQKNAPKDSISAAFFKSMYEEDQNARPLVTFYSKDQMIARNRTDSTNFASFMEHYVKYGFKGENELGVKLGEKSMWDIYQILFWHFIQVGYATEVLDLLHREFEDLNVPANILACLYDLQYNMSRGEESQYQYVNTFITSIGGKYYRPLIDYSEESIAQINSRRINLGLDSLNICIDQAVCSSFCNKGSVSYFNLEPFVSIESLPSMFFEEEAEKERLGTLWIDIGKTLNDCGCK